MKIIPIINDCKYDDGYLLAYNTKDQQILFAHFRKKIMNDKILCQELGELLQYISTYRPNNLILSLNQIQNFPLIYKKISLHFFQLIHLLGIKKLAFISNKTNQKDLLDLVKNIPLKSGVFQSRNKSKEWIKSDLN